MASTRIPESPKPLLTLSTNANQGATTYGAAVGLAQNTAAAIHTDLIAVTGDDATIPPLTGSYSDYLTAKAAKTTATGTSNGVERNCRAFCTSAVGVLKNYLGTHWSSQWNAVGFNDGSLAIPHDPLPLLGLLKSYFLNNPGHENTQLGITAANCEIRKGELVAARAAAEGAVAALGTAKRDNDKTLKTLYHRMTGVRAELDQLLEDDDPLWYDFGFDRPADGEGPGPVQHLVLTPGSAGMVFADWDDARRAERYRVLQQIIGTDPVPVEVENAVHDSEYTFTGLPSGAEVSITIVAVNSAGDGALSASAAIIVP